MKVVDGGSPINSIFTGDARNTFKLSKRLYEKGILSMAFVEPSVQQGECLIRLVASAGLRPDQVDRACGIIGECGCDTSWS